MCCLFGMVDYGNNFTGRQKALILSALGLECEARGTDATGVAYHSGGGLQVYKRPLPAHKLRLVLPNDAQTIMHHGAHADDHPGEREDELQQPPL